MAPLVDAIAQAVTFIGAQRSALSETMLTVTDQLGTILSDGRETADAEASRFRAECAAAEAVTVSRLSTALADASAQAFAGRIRAIDRRTSIMVALGLVGFLAIGAGGGLPVGRSLAQSSIAETEEGLRAAFREGPEAARLWLDLARWNNPRTAVLACRDAGGLTSQDGRLSCRVPLWVERPPSAKP